LGLLISYCIGLVCIFLPKNAIKVIQAISDDLLKKAEKRMNTEVDEDQTIIRPVFSIVIGVCIVAITYLAQTQSNV
jgi:CHASE3 domain sensor protein